MEIGMAKADLVQAGLLSNPTVGISLRFPSGGGLANLEAGLAQNIAELWQIPSRQRAASKTLERTILELARRATVLAAETKKAYGEKAYERWRSPRHMGPLDEDDGHARVRGACGDSMTLFLKFEGDRVKEASFQTEGCGASAVCGSLAAEMAIGKNPDDLMKITGEVILEWLGGLPRDEIPSAFHAAETLHQALRDYMAKETKNEAKST